MKNSSGVIVSPGFQFRPLEAWPPRRTHRALGTTTATPPPAHPVHLLLVPSNNPTIHQSINPFHSVNLVQLRPSSASLSKSARRFRRRLWALPFRQRHLTVLTVTRHNMTMIVMGMTLKAKIGLFSTV
jgi:hypothetical protein